MGCAPDPRRSHDNRRLWATSLAPPGPHLLFSVDNGLFGPATRLQIRLRKMIKDGRVRGTADVSAADCPGMQGSDLRDLVTGVITGPPGSGVQYKGFTDEASLLALINDDEWYLVGSVEC